jgi:hypothetical protein
MPPGWYPDAYGATRWWDGWQWTPHVAPPTRPVDSSNVRIAATLGVIAAAVIGGIMACFTSVSLLSGTTTVWVGVGLAAVATIAAFMVRQVGVWVRVVAVLISIACLCSAIYDEYQLQQKREQISQILDN